MRIITCAPLPPPNGGIANWYRILLSEGADKGYTFLNINTSPKKSIDGRTVFYRCFVQGFRMLGQMLELSKLIRRNMDVHTAHIATSGSLATFRDLMFMHLLKRKGIRVVYHIHFGRIPEVFERKKMEYHLLHKAIAMSDEVIAIDPKTYSVLCSIFGAEHIHYIPNPVRKVISENNCHEKNILFLGNVLREKGVDELMQAWEQLSLKYSDWNLTIAGFCEEEYKDQLLKSYSMNKTELLGFIPHEEAMSLLSKSAFLVLPSYTEGFPNVVIEAMMHGKAVIGTDVGAISDILSGGCGLVIPPQNVTALRDGIEKLIVNDKERIEMGRLGKEKAMSLYDSDIVFEKYTALWKC